MRREDQLRRREAQLMADIRDLEMARDTRLDAGRDPLEDLLRAKDKQIWDSDQRVREMQAQSRFTTTKVESQSVDVSTGVDSAMSFLEAELDLILLGHKTTMRASYTPLHDLSTLIQSICEDPELRMSEAQHLLRWNAKFGPEVIIKTLTLAAIREWVFYSTFPQPEDNESWLLPAYRNAIMVQGLSASPYLHNISPS